MGVALPLLFTGHIPFNYNKGDNKVVTSEVLGHGGQV